MSLDCETCDALLIDLVERELDEARAAEVRAHAASCESCARSLARLEGGQRAARELVRAEPPRLDAVMAAARARAAEVRAAHASESERERSDVAPEPSGPSPAPKAAGFLEGLLRTLGSWATGPQVAMAALLVLMVGIGLYNLPQFRGREGADPDGALVEPDVRAELGPSALDPADPLELAVDPRTQRVALGAGPSEEGAEESSGAHDVRPTTVVPDEVTHELVEAPTHERAPLDEAEVRAPALTELAAGESVGRVEDGPLPSVQAEGSQAAIVLAPAPPTAPATSPSTAPAPSVARSPALSFSLHDDSDGVAPETPSPAGLLPAAIHRQARSLASAGHCDEAAPRYRSLLTDHPDYADAPRAMIELAECDRRLGRIEDAQRWLARAETFPSVSAEARRARARLEVEAPIRDRAAAATDSDRATTSVPSASSY